MKTRVPAERVNHIVRYVPETCRSCAAKLPAEPQPGDPEPTWHQVAELPKIAAEITEYQGHARTCSCCGTVTRATIPADVRAHSVGPKLTATMGYLVGLHGVSKRGVEEMVEHVFDVSIALGTVANREQELSDALIPAHEEARAAIADAPVKHVDETGWKQAGKKRWLWAAATNTVAYFLIHPCRNLSALHRVVGEKLAGILVSDRWCVYDEWSVERRQLCWAHIKRNWEKRIERGGANRRVGEAWLAVQHRVFELWHAFRGGGFSRAELDERMEPLVEELGEVLWSGIRSRDRGLARFCARLQSNSTALWTFVAVEGVEPTNNRAERVQRRAVLWRRRSFGCHSAEGCRFVERLLTVVQTLRQQGRSVLAFLTETIIAHRAGTPAPQLIMG
jgi:transposase